MAAVVLSIFTVLTSVDAVCCPDGCTNEKKTTDTSQHSGEGTCMLCLGGMDASVGAILSCCGEVSDDAARLIPLSPDSITPDPLEHPPRG